MCYNIKHLLQLFMMAEKELGRGNAPKSDDSKLFLRFMVVIPWDMATSS